MLVKGVRVFILCKNLLDTTVDIGMSWAELIAYLCNTLSINYKASFCNVAMSKPSPLEGGETNYIICICKL